MNTEFKIIKTDKKGNIEKAAIMGAKAYYTKFQQPSVIYDQKDLPRNKQTHFEYTVELLVSEDTADSYDEHFPKQASKKMTKQQVMKKFKAESDEDLEEIGIDPKQKKFYFIKKVQAAQKKDGTALPKQLRPRVVEVIDNKPVDVTFDKLVGNGSGVDCLLRVSQNTTYGSFSYPAVLKVTDMIEYKASGNGGVDEETQDFLGGDLEFADEPEDNKQQVHEEEFEEEIPFDTDDSDDDEY